jgi:hypothetical protein
VVFHGSVLQEALEALHGGWESGSSHIVRYPGARTEMLIGDGTSWGEDIEACNQINLFWESGMARAAGFLDMTPAASDAADDGEG